MGHQMKIQLTKNCPLIYLSNYYTTWGALVIYEDEFNCGTRLEVGEIQASIVNK